MEYGIGPCFKIKERNRTRVKSYDNNFKVDKQSRTLDSIYGHGSCAIIDKEEFQKLFMNSKVKHLFVVLVEVD